MTIGFFLRAWRRIGAKLYPALGFAVFLTLVSSVVGVYYFKQSADASYEVRTESVPVLESSWAAAREGEKLRTLGARGLTEDVPAESVQEALEKLDIELASVGAVPTMVPNRDEAREKAYELVAVIDNLSISRSGSLEADQLASQLRGRLASPESADFAPVLQRMFLAEGQAGLEAVWQEFSGLPPSQADAAALGEEVFEVRAEQLLYAERTEELVASLHAASVALKVANSALLAEAQANSSETLQSSVTNFDRGRILLAVISIVRVGVATVTAWLLVGSGLVRSLTRLSERMRGMAGGDLETPVPGVGRDEMGEPAEALEVFPQQALEVQRLNLVETLYGELQEANAELQRVQDRLVAQEKLAALGELVSGVAHEISNPLNFVRNFAEVPVEMYEELTEVLGSYEDSMSEEDRTAIHDLEEDLADSLNRIRANGGRAPSYSRTYEESGSGWRRIDAGGPELYGAQRLGGGDPGLPGPMARIQTVSRIRTLPFGGRGTDSGGGLRRGRGELGVQCLLRHVVKAVRRRRGRVPAKATGLYRGRRRHDRAEGSGQRHGHIGRCAGAHIQSLFLYSGGSTGRGPWFVYRRGRDAACRREPNR